MLWASSVLVHLENVSDMSPVRLVRVRATHISDLKAIPVRFICYAVRLPTVRSSGYFTLPLVFSEYVVRKI